MTSYDQGGYLPPGLTIAVNGTSVPELVGGPAPSDPAHDPDWPDITPADPDLPDAPDHDEPTGQH